jgi:methylthioribose-1-phosphate isomerase
MPLKGSLQMPKINVPRTLRWRGGPDGQLDLIDQRLLPGEVVQMQCTTPEELFEAIVTLAVRGAPAIGVAAAFGVCLGVRSLPGDALLKDAVSAVRSTCDYLATSRPTAVNLFWALDRMRKHSERVAAESSDLPVELFKQSLLKEAQAIEKEDQQMCLAIGRHGMPLIPEGGAVLTHCNAGALATSGIGTALAPMYMAHQAGRRFRVYVDETRPLLQGARLTAWELTQAGIETVLICDNMAATLMQQGKVSAVITGADRIAANGDAANKIGTLGLSILARHYKVPFYIAAPSSTFDSAIATGSQIPIEQRSAKEITSVRDTAIAPEGISVYNPAFDVTPAAHITAFVTENGILNPHGLSL